MSTIERYIFKRIAIASIGATLIIVAIVWISQGLMRINFATGDGGSTGVFLRIMVFFLPQFLATVLPFGLVVGTVHALNTMNQDSETTVLASAGFGRWRLAKPVLIFSAIIAAYIALSSHLIEPTANSAARNLLVQSRADLLSTFIKEGRFIKVDDGLTIFVDRKNGSTLGSVMISDTRDPEVDFVYFAKEGAVGKVDGDTLLILKDGQIQRKGLTSRSVTIIRFQSYAISLSQFEAADNSSYYALNERSTSYLINPDPNDKIYKKRPGIVKAELHARMTAWIYPLVLGLAALVFAGKPRSGRTGNFGLYVVAFGTALTLRGLSASAYNANMTTSSNIYLLYLLPISAGIFFLWLFITHKTVAAPAFFVTWYDRLGETIRVRQVRRHKNRAA